MSPRGSKTRGAEAPGVPVIHGPHWWYIRNTETWVQLVPYEGTHASGFEIRLTEHKGAVRMWVRVR